MRDKELYKITDRLRCKYNGRDFSGEMTVILPTAVMCEAADTIESQLWEISALTQERDNANKAWSDLTDITDEWIKKCEALAEERDALKEANTDLNNELLRMGSKEKQVEDVRRETAQRCAEIAREYTDRGCVRSIAAENICDAIRAEFGGVICCHATVTINKLDSLQIKRYYLSANVTHN